MAIRSHTLTYDDLLRERASRDERLELIEGEITVTPSPSLEHQDVSGNLYVVLRRLIADTGQGRVYYAPIDVRLAERTIVQPDLVVVLFDRSQVLTSPRVEGTPSLVVEIVSPSTGARDRGLKRDVYARHGVPEYWLVDPDARTITIFSDPRDGHYHSETVVSDVAVSATIPGASVDLAALFAPVPGR